MNNTNRRLPSDAIGLAALEQRINEDLHWLNLTDGNSWLLAESQAAENAYPLLPVAIIGAGMSGLAAAMALRLNGVASINFDRAAAGAEGPWRSPALMQYLRSPKQVVGPAIGSPALSFQAWFRAQFGAKAWVEMDKIPRLQWAQYLDWYRQVSQAEVRNQYELTNLELTTTAALLTFNTPQGERKYYARQLVLALGMDAFGGHNIPDFVQNISPDKWIHSYDSYDYTQLKDKVVAVVGASAAAADTAATALEAGATAVQILLRCADFARVNRGKQASNSGFMQGYSLLTAPQKWHYNNYVMQAKTPPPRNSVLRVAAHPNAHWNFSSPVLSISVEKQQLKILTPKQTITADFLILATGYKLDWQRHRAYANLVDKLLLWQDVFQPSPAEANQALANYPYLNEDFSFLAKAEQDRTALANIYCFNYTANLSLGPLIGLIHGIDHGALRLANSISAKLYYQQWPQQLQQVKQSTAVELNGDEWHPAAAAE